VSEQYISTVLFAWFICVPQ